MRKRLFVFSFLVLSLFSVSGCESKGYSVPTFEKGQGISFTAYAGPTVANWAGNNNNPSTLTDEHYKKVAEAGFNKVIALYEGASSARGNDIYDTIQKRSVKASSDALEALALAEKYNIKYYVRDWAFYGLTTNFVDEGVVGQEQYKKIIDAMFDSNNAYIKSPAYAGNFGHDEPSYEVLEKIAYQIDDYNACMAKAGVKGEMMLNLNPCYVGGTSLSGNGKTYLDYVDYYFSEIAPKLGYVSYDYYPFIKDSFDGSYLRETYLYNLELMARHCKGTNIELRTFLQCQGDFTGLRDMSSLADLRFQINAEMAFGSRDIIYYTYVNENSASHGEFALLDYTTGEYNWTYDLAKKANNEAHAMEDAYSAYVWDGVMFHNASELYDNQSFANLVDPLTSHPRVSFVSSDQDSLLTSFKGKKDGSDAFMLLNYTDPYFKKNDTVTLHFNNAKALLMYRFGQKMIVNLPVSGDYTFVLYPGEGRFIIPLN